MRLIAATDEEDDGRRENLTHDLFDSIWKDKRGGHTEIYLFIKSKSKFLIRGLFLLLKGFVKECSKSKHFFIYAH